MAHMNGGGNGTCGIPYSPNNGNVPNSSVNINKNSHISNPNISPSSNNVTGNNIVRSNVIPNTNNTSPLPRTPSNGNSISLVNNGINANNIQADKSPNNSEKIQFFEKNPVLSPGSPLGSLTKNFKQLDSLTLKRYKKFHRLKLAGSLTKRELAEAIVNHFSLQKIDEDAVISTFVAHVRCSKESQREREQRRRNAARKLVPSGYDERYT